MESVKWTKFGHCNKAIILKHLMVNGWLFIFSTCIKLFCLHTIYYIDNFKMLPDYFLMLFRDTCSGGMNGYISLCGGEPCPPIFRSPVAGMDDIMDNHVM